MSPRSPSDAYAAQIARLNDNQRQALFEPANTVVLAGPGSGKTATLVLRIARQLDEVPPPRGVACVTYGTEAAREFEARLRLLGVCKGQRLFLGTVHAFCLSQILRPHGWRLSETLDDYEVASDEEAARARQKGLDAARINEDQAWWVSKISAFRQIVTLEPRRAGEFDDRLPTVAKAYRRALRAIKRIDFDDIVLLSLRLAQTQDHVRRVLSAKFPWFVVDEYQDLGLPLHRIVTTLLDQAGVRVFAVGDPDQSIYGFSGARPEFLNELATRPDVQAIPLRINYRCRQQIIDASLHVLQPETDRGFSAAETPDASTGEIIFHRCDEGLDQQAERTLERIERLIASGVRPGDIGVLGARWDDLASFTERLASRGIAFRVARGNKYKATATTQWVDDMARWCAGGWRTGQPRLRDLFGTWNRLLRSCRVRGLRLDTLDDQVNLYRMLSSAREPSLEVREWFKRIDRGLGLHELVSDVARIPSRMRYEARELSSMIEVMDASQQTLADFSGISRDKVVLQSIHGSKGLEYSAIFIPALEQGVLPRQFDDRREARRLFYVALTRAKREVNLLWSGFWYTGRGYRRDDGPSVFLIELAKRLES